MKNAYTIEGNVVKIELNRKTADNMVAKVDKALLPVLETIDGTFYPFFHGGRWLARCDLKQADGHMKLIQLHRLVAGDIPKGQKIIFLDDDGLNCTKANMVIAAIKTTREEILAEMERITPPPKSKVRGVTLHRASGTWYASAFWPPKERLAEGEEQKRYSSYWPTMEEAEAAMNKFREIGPDAFKKPSRKERAAARKAAKQKEEAKNG